jgi:hypothetical protein
MKIQATNLMQQINGCQPIKPVRFERQKSPKLDMNTVDALIQNDTLDKVGELEVKYDFACRLAAYYKTQYEKLLSQGECIA